jgi:hypothetical protein
MASGDFGGSARSAAKQLLREALAEQLGAAPLRSRELFRAARGGSARKTPQVPSKITSQGDLP